MRIHLFSPWLLLLGLFFSVQAVGLSAQELSRSVVGSAGDYFEHNLFGNIHWTVGEVAVSRFQNNLELDEGFHRLYYDLLVNSVDVLPDNWEVTVYPNPTIKDLRVRIPEDETVMVQLFSATGQIIKTVTDYRSETIIPMENLPAGVYWLRLQDEQGREGSFQVQKITY